MKVVILAAGVGSRLGMDVPKALATICGSKTILDYQVEQVAKIVPLQDVYVVVGYKREMLESKLLGVNYVYNEAYAHTNTGKSLLRGLTCIEESDVLWLNGDVVFDGELLGKLVSARCSAVLVDRKMCGMEEVKYTTDKYGYITRISKDIPEGEGEALGVNLIKKQHLRLFKRHLNLIAEWDYFEKALENMIVEDGVKVVAVDTGGLFCQEVDFPEELECVRSHFRRFGPGL